MTTKDSENEIEINGSRSSWPAVLITCTPRVQIVTPKYPEHAWIKV